MSKSFLKPASKLSQSCFKVVPQLSLCCLVLSSLCQSFAKVVSKFSQICPMVVLKLSQSRPRAVSKLSPNCFKWCSRVVHVLPKRCPNAVPNRCQIGPHPPTAHVWDSTKWKIKVKFILLFRLFRAFYFFLKKWAIFRTKFNVFIWDSGPPPLFWDRVLK